MAQLTLREIAAALAAADLFPALVDGAFKAVPADLLVYKDEDEVYRVGGSLEISELFGADTVWFGADSSFYFGNKARTLVSVTIQQSGSTIFDYDIEGLGNITVLGNADFGNSTGDTFSVAGPATFSNNTTFGNNSSKTATFNAKATFPNSSGIRIWDTDVSHRLGISLSSNLTADRTLSLITGDGNVTLDLSGGSMATQAPGAVAITGGTIVGLSSLGVGTATPFGVANFVTSAAGGTSVTAWGAGHFVISNSGSATAKGLGFAVDATGGRNTIYSLQPNTAWQGLDLMASSHRLYASGALVVTVDTAGASVIGRVTTDYCHVTGGLGSFANGGLNLYYAGGSGWISASSSSGGTLVPLSIASTLAPAGLLDISGASAGQIKFPATQNASADANTLDDYEEGTFTPSMSFGGGATGLTYSTRSGVYTKIGNTVYVALEISLSNKGSSTGAALISGLPFANGSLQKALAHIIATLTLTGEFQAVVAASASNLALSQQTSGTWSQLTDANFTNTSFLSISGTYTV